MSTEHLAVRTHEKMQEVLMHKDAEGPKEHYYMIRGGSEMRNITVWEIGTVSGEYIKTYGHYHVGDLAENYDIIHGEGVALLQKRVVRDGVDIDDEIEEFKAIAVKPGDRVYMPAGYGHLVVNTGSVYLVSSDDSPVNFSDADPVSMPGHADYEPVKRMRGFAFYVVEHEGAPALVRNTLYKEIILADFGGLPVLE